jgi:hypothetical protein
MRKIITFSLLWLTVCSFGQYKDNFSDGEFASNPSWIGTADKFVVAPSLQLQLKAPAASSSAYLATSSGAIYNASWQFYLKAGLLLTSGNYVDFYLVADNSDLSKDLNGYYVMVGNTNKEVALYRQSGKIKTRLVAGVSKRLPASGSVTEITVRVTRDAAGNWALYSKLSSESDFVLEGTVYDAAFDKSNFSGIYCKYSTKNSQKFVFDDFAVTGSAVLDTVPPSIVSYNLAGDRKLKVVFSEPVSLSGAMVTVPATLGSYTQNLSGDTLTFLFDKPAPRYQTFVITLDKVADVAGNFLPKSELSFGLFPTTFGDLIFNEIMCDSSPKVGLPETEYIELYNRKDFPVDLSGWKLYYGDKPYKISGGKIPANGYLLLCAFGSASTLSSYGTTATMSSFPSLSSTGQLLYLTNEKDSLISFVNYSNSWYRNDFKASGGWSLECVDSENLSSASSNWVASSDVSGGTPGRKNSSVAIVKDNLDPHVAAVSYVLPDTLLVVFNKSMSLSDLSVLSHYVLGSGLEMKSAKADYPQGKWVKLALSPAPQKGSLYQLQFNHLRDVNQNLLSEKIMFGVPDSCEYNDLVINEVLSHPKNGGATFVELYNRSQKVIELKNLWLNRIKPGGVLDVGSPLAPQGRQVLPGEYLILTDSQKGVSDFYDCKTEGKWNEMSNFVSLPNTSGNVMLVSRVGAVIDSVSYDEKRHDATIKDPSGVSFERVNPDWASDNADNWHSCASDAGYATPGYANSQFRQMSDSATSVKYFWLDNESFTPDNDGVEDVLLLRYKMPDNGYSATVTIYDAMGRRVRQIANNALLGGEGVLIWNGLTDAGKLANAGVYVVYVDAVLPLKGKREKTKIACVVAVK